MIPPAWRRKGPKVPGLRAKDWPRGTDTKLKAVVAGGTDIDISDARIGQKRGGVILDLRFRNDLAAAINDPVAVGISLQQIVRAGGQDRRHSLPGPGVALTCAKEDRTGFGIRLRGRKGSMGKDQVFLPCGEFCRQWRQGSPDPLAIAPRSGGWPLASGPPARKPRARTVGIGS